MIDGAPEVEISLSDLETRTRKWKVFRSVRVLDPVTFSSSPIICMQGVTGIIASQIPVELEALKELSHLRFRSNTTSGVDPDVFSHR